MVWKNYGKLAHSLEKVGKNGWLETGGGIFRKRLLIEEEQGGEEMTGRVCAT